MTDYEFLCSQLEALTQGVASRISNLANAASLLYNTLPTLNWAGFYLYEDGALRLGPSMGQPACVVISPGKGVCGSAFAAGETLVVPDVHAFPGHIACDAASRSEIVVPLFGADGEVAGVLDLDSASPARFTKKDAEGLEAFARIIEKEVFGRA